jgi:DNA-binding beta-propeller fold protein YncE
MRIELVGRSAGCSRVARPAALGLALAISLLAGLGPSLDGSRAEAAPAIVWERCDADEAEGQRCDNPRGIAGDPTTGRVFVADQGFQRIVEFDALGTFLRAWGWDVVESGPGDDTSAPEDEFEICVPNEGDTCKAGVAGSGIGQLQNPLGVAVDSEGSVYVLDFSNGRVQKFDSKGNFQLMIGGQVNETSGGNVCPRPGFPTDVCKASEPAASGGGGQGELGSGLAIGDYIEVDSNDNVYVGDVGRIQHFDADGVYQDELTVAGAVQSLTVDPSGNLYYVAGSPQIRKISPGGEEIEPVFELPRPPSTVPNEPLSIAVDSRGHLFAYGSQVQEDSDTPMDRIFEFDPAGNLVDQFGKGDFNSSQPNGLAANLCEGSEPPGNLYVSNTAEVGQAFVRAYGTPPLGCLKARTTPATAITEMTATLNGTVNPKGEAVTSCFFEWGETIAYGNVAPCEDPGAGEIGTGNDPVPVHADVAGLQRGTVYHFRLRAEIGGELESGVDLQLKTLGPPVISEEHTVDATYDEATVKALVNPEGFATSCHVEYGADTLYGQSSAATAVGSDRSEHSVAFVLGGLAQGTTYHWRFVCPNSSDTTIGQDRIATTYRAPGVADAEPPCANEAFRTAGMSLLHDCRAYEMVSPVDKNGADVTRGLPVPEGPGNYVQVSPDGERITYTTARFPAFGEEPPNSFAFNQYLAVREESDPRDVEDGWASEGIHPPFEGKGVSQTVVTGAFREFMGFSPDLCSAWLIDYQTPALLESGQDGFANLLRRDNCEPGVGGFETLTRNSPPPGTAAIYMDENAVQGHSVDSRHSFFVARAKLTPDAASGVNGQIYDSFCPTAAAEVCDGGGSQTPLSVVSVRPGLPGVADSAGAVVGSGALGNLDNAVSEDGSRVYWTSGSEILGFGQIFVRLHPEQGIVAGECSEPEKACTVRVSKPFAVDAMFWAASPGGSSALYSEGDLKSGTADLFRFDLATKTSQPIAEDILGVAGTSENLSRVYFFSEQALSGEASAGAPNLYLAEGGGVTFVATLVEGDLGADEPDVEGDPAPPYDLRASNPYRRATRVSPDGSHIAFQSRAPLTDYDNTDVGSGKRAVEIYLYEAGGQLLCVSCNPSGARPQGREIGLPYQPNFLIADRGDHKVVFAAWIPTWEHPQHASNVLSDDGQRLFFNADDPLLPRDANGAQDVYEWEAAGTGSCDVGDHDYFPQNGGCLYLISTGESSFESEVWEATPDGEDVFFTTDSQLVGQDPGSIDLYDARVNGGFPEPVQKLPCEGEACQSAPPAPAFPAPGSATYDGPGDIREAGRRKRCPKGKRRVKKAGKVRCVKKRGGKRQRRGEGERGAR